MDQDFGPRAKRRKIESYQQTQSSGDSIKAVGDLQNALHFRQSSSHDVKHGIQTFKDFLTDIGKIEDVSAQAEKLRLLKGYCESQSAGYKNATCFSDLISTWAFGVEVKNDSVLSAVPAVLALFLKTVSTHLEFREFGISLCKTLLQKEQLQLLDRGLTATKTKEHLISPCLRLLTEIVSFDGGAVASNLYSRRDVAFKRLDIFLSHKVTGSSETEEDRRRPTLRRIAQRYVLANLRFQSVSARGDIIAQGRILRAFLQGIREDGADIVSDILQTIQKSIVNETSLSRNLKTRFLNQSNLAAISTLYGFAEAVDNQAGGKDIRAQAHKLLHEVCTQHEKGILLPQTGWYPIGTNPEVQESDSSEENSIDLGLDSPLNFDSYQDKIPVKNGTLSAFIQSLRPETDNLQANLVLDTFQAAPELVADYFSKKNKFNSEAKESASWLGQAAFLFSTIQLPVPNFCGWKDVLPRMPPPLSIVIENVLPRPLDRGTMIKCFNMNHEVVTLFGLRAMTVAFQKLQQTLDMFTSAGSNKHLWEQASLKLVTLFSQRCPLMKDVITVLQRAPKNDLHLRGASIELLAMYFQVLPHLALSEKFDISLAIADLIERLEAETKDPEVTELLLDQLNHLLQISQISANTKWWQKPEVLKLSPFSSMLKIVSQTVAPSPVVIQIKALLETILLENGILRRDTRDFEVLLASLKSTKKWAAESGTFTFMDNCMSRIVRQPVHYQDLQHSAIDGTDISLLVVSMVEQWPFLAKSDDSQLQKNVALWIARLLMGFEVAEGDKSSVTRIRDDMLKSTDEEMRIVLQDAFEKQGKRPLIMEHAPTDEAAFIDNSADAANVDKDLDVVLDDVFGSVLKSPESLEGLDKWDKAEFESTIASGRMGRLIRCLASEEAEVRRQAFITLTSLMQQVEDSTYSEKRSVYILLGEVCETVKEIGLDSQPVPSIIVEIAAQALFILADPSHKLYGKINKFLNKGPVWELNKTLPYWIDKILLREPEEDNTNHDNGHVREVDWLLGLLVNALRSPRDMDLYRRANVFERILSLYTSPALTPSLSHKILHLVYRSLQISGGAMTLITRAGISSWLQIQLAMAEERRGSGSGREPSRNNNNNNKQHAILRALKRALEESCEKDNGGVDAVRKWQLLNGKGGEGGTKTKMQEKTKKKKKKVENGVVRKE